MIFHCACEKAKDFALDSVLTFEKVDIATWHQHLVHLHQYDLNTLGCKELISVTNSPKRKLICEPFYYLNPTSNLILEDQQFMILPWIWFLPTCGDHH